MATTFLEPGGDADFLVGTTNGFWTSLTGVPTTATDFVHGSHRKSLKLGTGQLAVIKTGIVADSGSRLSFYIYLVALPTTASGRPIAQIRSASNNGNVYITLTSGGVLQLFNQDPVQIGSSGSTLLTGHWYRISLSYTITSSTVNRFELFLNGVSNISVTNATITNTTSNRIYLGNIDGDATLDLRISDIYVDDSSSLLDTGDIWVTAKRPISNGTTNGFSLQIGSGGSGYGSGHSSQVNERPLSTTNGWSMVGAGSAITEEYTIEDKGNGDINIEANPIIDFVGWVSASSLVGETASIIVAGVSSNISLTSTVTMFTKVAGSVTYPLGGTDIGIITDTSLTTVSLYECGIIVAFKIGEVGVFGNYDPYIEVGDGMSRNERAT